MGDAPDGNVFNFSPKKRPQRHFTIAEKEVIINIYKGCERNHPDYSKGQKVNYTAGAAGVSVRSVYNIIKNYEKTHTLQPPKNYHRPRSILDNIDEETKHAVRRIIHSFLLRNEPPTVRNILAQIEENEEIPNFKETTFRHLLREIGFRYAKRSRSSILKERDETICWRRCYLRSIKKIRQDNTKIYYLYETWVNAGDTISKVWTDTTVAAAKGKGKRLIVLHIGSEDGFVQDGQLVFQSKQTNDEEIKAQVFEEWFKKILPRLEESCVIVLNNASYHRRKLEKIPTSATRKADIQSWLASKNIPYEEDMVKVEILQLVKENRNQDKYVVDEMAKATGRTILRLPPYHCELNPIELIWTQVKSEVARKNVTCKFPDLKPLFDQAVQNVSPQNWKKAVDYVLKEEERMWIMDDMMEVQAEPPNIDVGQDANTSTSDSDQD